MQAGRLPARTGPGRDPTGGSTTCAGVRPGSLITCTVDVRKLGRFPNGGGHRTHGRVQGEANARQGTSRKAAVKSAGRSGATPLFTVAVDEHFPGSSTPRSFATKPEPQRPHSCATPSPPSKPRARQTSKSNASKESAKVTGLGQGVPLRNGTPSLLPGLHQLLHSPQATRRPQRRLTRRPCHQRSG